MMGITKVLVIIYKGTSLEFHFLKFLMKTDVYECTKIYVLALQSLY